jgi:type VI secretion system protein ImpH
MADEDRAPPHSLEAELYDALHATPYDYDFFQSLRRIDALKPDRPRIGESARLADDPVRLAQIPSLIFAPATMASFEFGAQGRPPRLSTYFFGIFGPSGALPLHLTEYARDRIRNSGDRTFARFVDVFHHRMLSLFYRAWAASQPTVSFDRPGADRFGVYVASLFGLGLQSLRDRDAMPDLAKLHFAGRFAHQARNAEGLRAIIADYFKLPVEIEEFVGDWVSLPRNSLCLLGRTPETGTLGTTASIGERLHVYHHKFRVLFGPIRFADYARLLPGGTSLKRLVPIIRNYVGDEFSWDVNLILLENEVPELRLGQAGLLGWTTWLGTRRSEQDAAELLLNPYRSAA